MVLDKITEGEIEARLAKKLGISNAAANRNLNALKEVMANAIEKKEPFTIRGLFSYSVVRKAERTNRNPKTGASFLSPAHWKGKIQLSRGLDQLVKKS